MKRKILITAAILLTGAISHAQDLDIKPSQQAQGLLESKNAMVDHTTGLFHYKVPLHEIKSGDFALPISLNYIAKGVKVQDQPGLIGYNWTLNTGGVVTRTIRGGIADEDGTGILNMPLSATPTAAEIESVNKRERDGETDIFTAQFNGKNINFRIVKDNLNHLILAEPLEKTNVKITCESSNEINAWIIIDEAGNKYTFGQKEWISNINREGITSNGIQNKSYISAWYLNKIEPTNGSEIDFSYISEVRNMNNHDSICSIKHYNKNSEIYSYGQEISESPYNFAKYQHDFKECISEASTFINLGNVQMQVNGYVEMFVNGRVMPNPFITSSVVNANFKVMGVLHEFSGISVPSKEIINYLDNLINLYENHASVNIQMGVSFLKSAKHKIIECLVEIVNTKEKVECHSESFEICSPLLSMITCKDKIISFSYNKGLYGYKLSEIDLLDINMERIKGVKLYNDKNLAQISYLDRNRNEYDKISFNYFTELGNDVTSDLWGYYKKILPHTSNKINMSYFDNRLDLNNSRYRTLSSITSKIGSKVTLEYESNVIREWRGGITHDYGGLRISKITISDSNAGNNDIINYRYPIGGISVYQDYSNTKSIYYPQRAFSDKITFDKIIYEGNAYISLGNNSLYYPQVEEEFVGKGKNKYFFYIPTSNLYDKFPYLLFGLPLSKEIYDVNNNLKSIVNFKYHTNETLSGLISSDSDTPTICAFNKNITQIKAYSFYMNAAKIEEHYRNLKQIPCGGNIFINPYAIYEYNIKPRIEPQLPTDQTYEISYGGCVLLKEKIEYSFDENSLGQNSNNCYKTEYYYDNFKNSTLPTRIITTQSDGNQEVEIIKRVTEMSNNVGVIVNKMKSKNIYNSIMKTQRLVRKNSASNYRLIEENVYDYGDIENNIRLMKISRYNPTDYVSVTVKNPMIDNTLYEQSNYNIEKTFNYQSYLPTYVTNLNEKLLTRYDLLSDAVILTSKNAEENSIQAADKFNRYSLLPENNYLNFHQIVSNFYEDLCRLSSYDFTPNFRNYMIGDESKQFIAAIEDIYFNQKKLNFNDFKSYTGVAVRNFVNLYLAEINSIAPGLRLRIDYLMQLRYGIDEITSDVSGYKYQYIISMDKNDIANNHAGFLINNVSSSKYKIFLLNNSLSNESIEYQISHSKGKYLGNSSFTGSNNWQLSIIDIDLNNFTNIESLNILPTLNTNIAYMAIVPADAEFEATSYNADGTLFCKFNQNGQLERYEYDAAGRIIKIYDNDNNLLKEFTYNVIL